jgi:hypothetical protein
LESPARPREDEDARAALVLAEHARRDLHVGGHAVAADVLGAQHLRLPDFGLAADDAPGELVQLARRDQLIDLGPAPALDRLIELRDGRAHRLVGGRGLRPVGAQTRGASGEGRRVTAARLHGLREAARGLGRLPAPERDLAESD